MVNSGLAAICGVLVCLACGCAGSGDVWVPGQGGSGGLSAGGGKGGGSSGGAGGEGASNGGGPSGGSSSGAANGGTSSGATSSGGTGGGGTGGTGPTGGMGGSAVVGCNPNGTFGEAIPIGELNTPGNEAAARLTSNELTVVFERDGDLYIAERASRLEPFLDLGPIPGVANESTESAPWLSDDGLILYYESSLGYDINMATRAARSAPFDPSTQLGLNTLGNATDPYAVGGPNGSLFFTSNFDAIVSVGLAGWLPQGSASAALTPTLTPTFVRSVVTSDLLTVFATEDDSGDILRAQRTASNLPFGATAVVSELVTGENEYASWISPDGCRLYFDRGPSNNRDFFVAQILQ